jgi:hypothetical protein
VEKYGRSRQATDDKIIQRVRLGCWKAKDIETPSEYLMLTAFPQKHCLRERASILHYTYIARLVDKSQSTKQ